jgi:hypothetical protein
MKNLLKTDVVKGIAMFTSISILLGTLIVSILSAFIFLSK